MIETLLPCAESTVLIQYRIFCVMNLENHFLKDPIKSLQYGKTSTKWYVFENSKVFFSFLSG